MVKVLVFGSFDLVHEGHEYFFREARELGDELVVVVARDSTIKKIKGKTPKYNENQRLGHVRKIKEVDRVVLGGEGDDKYKIIEKVNPNVIALGYDQDSFSDGLSRELKMRGLGGVKVVRLDGYMVDKYKSSLLKRANKE